MSDEAAATWAQWKSKLIKQMNMFTFECANKSLDGWNKNELPAVDSEANQ